MTRNVIFYEKPGCVGNRQQKELLAEHACELDVRDLLTTFWSAETLRPFFGDMPVHDWFNTSAPHVKSGGIDIFSLDETQALDLMLTQPLLIRRPLMKYGEYQQAGFAQGPVLDTLGIDIQNSGQIDSCPVESKRAESGMPL